jgi:hypothetical protein
LDQGIHSKAVRPRTCCAAFLRMLYRLTQFERIYRNYRSFWGLSTGNYPSTSSALAAPNLKDLPKTHMAFWWAICPRGETHPRPTMDCSLWKDFPSLPSILLIQLPAETQPELSTGKLPVDVKISFRFTVWAANARRTTSASLATTGRVFLLPYREAPP